MIDREFERKRSAFELSPPVVQMLIQNRTLHPCALPCGKVCVIEGALGEAWLLTGLKLGVPCREILKHDRGA